MTLARSVALGLERVARPVESMHRTIASRWFRAVGPIGRPVQVGHDAVVDLVYTSIRVGARGISGALDASRREEPGAAPVTARAWVNGLWGDALAPHDRLDIAMTALDMDGDPLALPAGRHRSTRLVFLLHGLADTERRWLDPADGRAIASSLSDAGSTPILVRYNTGLPVATNAGRLAGLIDRVVDDWPVAVEAVALVGHSMGGLVVLGAAAEAASSGRGWTDALTDVVTIGTPHGGAPLERVARLAASGLGVAAVTRPLGEFLEGRSGGIKDLGGRTPGTASPVLPRHVRRRVVGGVITRDPAHPLGSVLGDLMVGPASATSPPATDVDGRLLVGGVGHLGLLTHPTVVEQVVSWLTEPGRAPTGALPQKR